MILIGSIKQVLPEFLKLIYLALHLDNQLLLHSSYYQRYYYEDAFINDELMQEELLKDSTKVII
jgi:hypothetical protein